MKTSRLVSVCYFSRGRGMGHATADASLCANLQYSDVTFVSYAEGFNVFQKLGLPCIDLGLPADNAYLDTLQAVLHVLAGRRPQVVIAREEFSVFPIAAALNIPSIFVSDWLPPPGHIGSESLRYADRCYIFENEGIFPVPKLMRCVPEYFGPIRKPVPHHASRSEMRKQLGVSEKCRIILVVPGGWFNESRAPISDLLIPAFDAVKAPEKLMIWISGSDHSLLSEKIGPGSKIRVLQHVPNIFDYMEACDAVITKGTRGATMDAASLGVPSIALSFAQNPIDELVIPRIRTNTHLNAKFITVAGLAKTIMRVLEEPRPAPVVWPNETEAVLSINAAVMQLSRSRSPSDILDDS